MKEKRKTTEEKPNEEKASRVPLCFQCNSFIKILVVLSPSRRRRSQSDTERRDNPLPLSSTIYCNHPSDVSVARVGSAVTICHNILMTAKTTEPGKWLYLFVSVNPVTEASFRKKRKSDAKAAPDPCECRQESARGEQGIPVMILWLPPNLTTSVSQTMALVWKIKWREMLFFGHSLCSQKGKKFESQMTIFSITPCPVQQSLNSPSLQKRSQFQFE